MDFGAGGQRCHDRPWLNYDHQRMYRSHEAICSQEPKVKV